MVLLALCAAALTAPATVVTVVSEAQQAAAAPQHADHGGGPAGGSARKTLNLDGTWTFALDPDDRVTKLLTTAGKKTNGTIAVPGAWQAQGYGQDTFTMHHAMDGVGIFSREIVLPAGFEGAGRRLFFVANRVQRSAKLFVRDPAAVNVSVTAPLASHLGYLSLMEAELTNHTSNGRITLTVAVNSTRDNPTDCLRSTEDDAAENDFTGLSGWGGFGGHVRLESRAAVWIVDPFVQHSVADDLASADVNVSVRLGDASASTTTGRVVLNVTYATEGGSAVVGQSTVKCPAGVAATCAVPSVKLVAPALWSPRSPVQYTAVVRLLDAATGAVLDNQRITFGIRRLDIVNRSHWKLNGQFLFLHGYGDDSVYPLTYAPPNNVTFYRERLSFAKSLGFNYVRPHSHILPAEYFQAACAEGFLISAEFPLGFGGPAKACWPHAMEEWSAIIKQLRNYPCVLDYTMANEQPWNVTSGVGIANRMYETAKSLDPTRPVLTSDGMVPAAGALASNFGPEDFRTTSFRDNLPLNPDPAPEDQHIFAIDQPMMAPVIDHEMGNFGLFPTSLDTYVSGFRNSSTASGAKPFWVEGARDILAERGLLQENELWGDASSRTWLASWKSLLEGLRKQPLISGYQWWTLYDYWGGYTGLLDPFGVSKISAERLEEVKLLNSDVQLLIAQPGDDLELPEASPRLNLTYVSGQVLNTSVHLSNWGAVDIRGAVLRWRVESVTAPDGASGRVLCKGEAAVALARVHPNLTMLTNVSCVLPNLDAPNATTAPQPALSLRLNATLSSGADGAVLATNSWRARLFPNLLPEASPPNRTVYAPHSLCSLLPVGNINCQPSLPSIGFSASVTDIFVADYLDASLLEKASQGATVMVFLDGSPQSISFSNGDDGLVMLPSQAASWQPSWWTGSRDGNFNQGRVVYKKNSFLASLAPEGWADESWWSIVTGGADFLTDLLPAPVEVLVRSVVTGCLSLGNAPGPHGHTQTTGMSMLWQVGIQGTSQQTVGKEGGTLIVSGFNLIHSGNVWDNGRNAVPHPDAAWMLRQLMQYAYSRPVSKAKMSFTLEECTNCWPAVSARLAATNKTNTTARIVGGVSE